MHQAVEVVLYEMREKRSPTTFDELMTTTTQQIDDHKLTEIKIPRSNKLSSPYAGPEAAYAPATITDNFRPLMYSLSMLPWQQYKDDLPKARISWRTNNWKMYRFSKKTRRRFDEFLAHTQK